MQPSAKPAPSLTLNRCFCRRPWDLAGPSWPFPVASVAGKHCSLLQEACKVASTLSAMSSFLLLPTPSANLSELSFRMNLQDMAANALSTALRIVL
mmetsp:Transcript_5292/g.4022  ORF Transcript_5292/g.4022 Transcript_5292/m.4022 type:complete len:96 (+) Transcript_5292:2355-2642(+)